MNGVFDIARGAYSRMPPGLPIRLGGVLNLVPVQLQYGTTYSTWRARIAGVQHDPGGVRRHQDRARTELLQAAFARSPYYREVLTRTFVAGFDPARVQAD